MPDVAEPPSGLAKLFELELPEEPTLAAAEHDDVVESFAPPAAKPPVKPAEPAAATVVETAKEEKPATVSDITKRLAPDFSATVGDEPPPIVDEHPDITEEMIAAEPDAKKQANMRELGKALSNYKRQVAELTAKASAAPVGDTDGKTLLEAVTKERDDLLARVERANLLDSPKFQKEHLEPRDKEFRQAQGIVKDAGGDPTKLQRAISMSGKARVELLDEIREEIPSEMMKGRFDRLIESIDNRTLDINARLANAKTESEQSRIQEKVQSQEQMVEVERQLKGLLGSARRDLLDNVKLEVLQKVGKKDFEWWDSQVDEIDAVAEEILLKSTPEKAAIAAYLAASAGAFRSMWQAERAARIAEQKENAELRGADPKITRERKAASTDPAGVDMDDPIAKLRAGMFATRK